MRHAKPRKRPVLRRTHLPCVEALEDRCLLSTLPQPLLVAGPDDAVARLVDARLRDQHEADITPRIAAVTATATPPSFTVQSLQNMSASNTAYKQQSKVWTYDNKWWSVVADSTGTWLWRLDGTAWMPVLQVAGAGFRADVRAVGNLAHIMLYSDIATTSRLATVEYVPPSAANGGAGSYKMWSARPTLADPKLSTNARIATLDIDSTGRLWIASDGLDNVEMRYSDRASNYATWSNPITIATGIGDTDTSIVIAMPGGTIGVFWGNQKATRFGFRYHRDRDAQGRTNDPNDWSSPEVPAGEAALNLGRGMADDHMNLGVGSDGTLYAAVKTGYDTEGFTMMGLLVRRPSGVWDPQLYNVDFHGTRPIVLLNETAGRLLYVYGFETGDNRIVYRESALSPISFGDKLFLMDGANVTSTKQNWTKDVVVLAAGQGAKLTMREPNKPPVLTKIGNRVTIEGTRLSIVVSASDANQDPLTYSVSGMPAGAIFQTGFRTLQWTPTESQDGTYPVTFNVSDGFETVSETIAITVVDTNRPPALAPVGSKSVEEVSPLTFTVAATDGDVVSGVPDTVTLSASGLPDGATLDPSTGAFNWTPTERQDGAYTVTFNASDGRVTTSETITITVAEVQRPPVFSPFGDKSVDGGALLAFAISASDTDGDPLSYSATGLPAGASFDPGTQTFSWTPALRQDGSYRVAFHVNDGFDTTAQTITIRVGAPVLAAIGDKSVPEGSLLAFTIAASDAAGDPLSYSASGLPMGATFDSGTQSFRWTPTDVQDGVYHVTFSVADGATTTSETVTISVLEVNQAPVLAPIGDKRINEGSPISITVSAKDADVVNGSRSALSYSATGLPSGATFNPDTRVFAWTPSEAQDGTRRVTFNVSDGTDTTSETITITVGELNQPFVMQPIGPKKVAEGSPLSFLVPATDPDSVNGSPAPLNYSATGLPVGARLDSRTGAFAWTPAENQDGTYRVTFSVSDGTVTLSETIVITVSEVSQGPVFTPIGDKSVTQGSPLSVTISATDPDFIKGVPQKLKCSVAKLPTGSTFNTTSRTFSWTPKAAGVYRVSFVVTDGAIKTTETITITVTPRNPIAPATATRDGIGSHAGVDTAIAMLAGPAARLPGSALGNSGLLADLLDRVLPLL